MYSNYLQIINLPRNGADKLALGLVALHKLVRFHNLFPVKDFLNVDFEAAVLELWQRMLDQLIPQLALVVLVSASEGAALEMDSLPDKGADVLTTLELSTTHDSKVDDAAIHGGSAKVLVKVWSANEVDDDVYTFTVCLLKELLGPVALLSVECSSRAELVDAKVTFVI